jgi:hypothetical protein
VQGSKKWEHLLFMLAQRLFDVSTAIAVAGKDVHPIGLAQAPSTTTMSRGISFSLMSFKHPVRNVGLCCSERGRFAAALIMEPSSD